MTSGCGPFKCLREQPNNAAHSAAGLWVKTKTEPDSRRPAGAAWFGARLISVLKSHTALCLPHYRFTFQIANMSGEPWLRTPLSVRISSVAANI